MKKVNAMEMRNVEGGLWLAAALGVAIGRYVGIEARIMYEHTKYGYCKTYRRYCNYCKK